VLKRARTRRWLLVHRDTLVITATALLVRLVYNLILHPPMNDLWADMNGYVGRARQVFDATPPHPEWAFFPYGTHGLLGVVMGAFGRSAAVINVFYALLGTAAVTFTFLSAKRLMPRRYARVAGALLVVHVPWITMGGFVLSEMPFACALSIVGYFSLRWLGRNRLRDAFIAGAVMAVACIIRPQALVALPFMLYHGLRAPRQRTRARGLVAFAVPIAIVLSLSALRLHHHTGRVGLVSTNSGFNFAVGRCHCVALIAMRDKGQFNFAGFKYLNDSYRDTGVRPLIDLSPALGETIGFDGKLWDPTPATELARRCMAATGPWVQAKYSLTHVILLWAYNIPWPTGGVVVGIGQVLQAIWVPGLFVALFSRRGGPRARARRGMLAAHVWSLFITVMIFFGEARFRIPYDGMLMTLSMTVTGPWLARFFAAKKAAAS
jgi:hypothetical protein